MLKRTDIEFSRLQGLTILVIDRGVSLNTEVMATVHFSLSGTKARLLDKITRFRKDPLARLEHFG